MYDEVKYGRERKPSKYRWSYQFGLYKAPDAESLKDDNVLTNRKYARYFAVIALAGFAIILICLLIYDTSEYNNTYDSENTTNETNYENTTAIFTTMITEIPTELSFETKTSLPSTTETGYITNNIDDTDNSTTETASVLLINDTRTPEKWIQKTPSPYLTPPGIAKSISDDRLKYSRKPLVVDEATKYEDPTPPLIRKNKAIVINGLRGLNIKASLMNTDPKPKEENDSEIVTTINQTDLLDGNNYFQIENSGESTNRRSNSASLTSATIPKPKPFHFELQGLKPQAFTTSQNTPKRQGPYPQLQGYRYPTSAKNIQDIIDFLTNNKEKNDNEGSEDQTPTKLKFTGKYKTGGSVDVDEEPVHNRKTRKNKDNGLINYNTDPFFYYKPSNPYEVNLLAGQKYRFAPNMIHNHFTIPDEEDYASGDVGDRRKRKPLSVMLDIYPMSHEDDETVAIKQNSELKKNPAKRPNMMMPHQYMGHNYAPGHDYNNLNALYHYSNTLSNNNQQYAQEMSNHYKQQQQYGASNNYYDNYPQYRPYAQQNMNYIQRKKPVLERGSTKEGPQKMVVHLNLYPRKKTNQRAYDTNAMYFDTAGRYTDIRNGKDLELSESKNFNSSLSVPNNTDTKREMFIEDLINEQNVCEKVLNLLKNKDDSKAVQNSVSFRITVPDPTKIVTNKKSEDTMDMSETSDHIVLPGGVEYKIKPTPNSNMEDFKKFQANIKEYIDSLNKTIQEQHKEMKESTKRVPNLLHFNTDKNKHSQETVYPTLPPEYRPDLSLFQNEFSDFNNNLNPVHHNIDSSVVTENHPNYQIVNGVRGYVPSPNEYKPGDDSFNNEFNPKTATINPFKPSISYDKPNYPNIQNHRLNPNEPVRPPYPSYPNYPHAETPQKPSYYPNHPNHPSHIPNYPPGETPKRPYPEAPTKPIAFPPSDHNLYNNPHQNNNGFVQYENERLRPTANIFPQTGNSFTAFPYDKLILKKEPDEDTINKPVMEEGFQPMTSLNIGEVPYDPPDQYQESDDTKTPDVIKRKGIVETNSQEDEGELYSTESASTEEKFDSSEINVRRSDDNSDDLIFTDTSLSSEEITTEAILQDDTTQLSDEVTSMENKEIVESDKEQTNATISGDSDVNLKNHKLVFSDISGNKTGEAKQ